MYMETRIHTITSCLRLAHGVYWEGHNQVAGAFHWDLGGQYHLPRDQRWWKQKPNSLTENDEAEILWDFTL